MTEPTPDASQRINWDAVHEAWIIAQRGGDANAFITLAMPLAKSMTAAGKRTHRADAAAEPYDNNEMLSAAMDALLQVSTTPVPNANTTPDWLRQHCAETIAQHMLSAKQELTTSRGGKLFAHLRSPAGRGARVPLISVLAHRENPAAALTDFQDEQKHILSVLKNLLGEEEYRCMSAFIRMKPLAYDNEEIAARLGKSPSTFNSTLSHARTKIDNFMPELRSRLEDLLHEEQTHDRSRIRSSRVMVQR